MPVNDLYRSYRLSWFGQPGESSDVALMSRVSLSRNFARLPFPNRADMKQLATVQNMANSVFADIEAAVGQEFDAIGLDGLTEMERRVLEEKELVSREMLDSTQYRSAYISADRRVSILVNEEDHLRIQCMAPGLDLEAPFAAASRIDDAIEAKLDMAFDEKMGYLTSSPTNLGTGLRAEVMLHLPGLAYTRNINSVASTAQQLGILVQGGGSKDNEAAGHFFEATNQMTLGCTEAGLLETLTGAVKEIIAHERRARKALLLYSKERLEDAVWRAYGILCYARSLGEKEVEELVSKVRLGIDLDLLDAIPSAGCADLLLASRPEYIKNLSGNENLSPPEIDRHRAVMVRCVLAHLRQEGTA